MHDETLIAAEHLVDKIEIPPQPKLLVAINAEAKKKDCNFTTVADLICSDMSVASEVLKTANSPVFGKRRTIGSIQQAISLLGLKRTIALVRDVSLKQTLNQGLHLESFWQESFKTANACALIAKKTGIVDAEEAYTFGLFHNAGIPILSINYKNYHKIIGSVSLESGPQAITLEEKHYKLNHAIVGYYLCSKWLLPEHICKAVFYHHRLQSVIEKNSKKETQLAGLLVTLFTAQQAIKSNDHELKELSPELKNSLFNTVQCNQASYQTLINTVQEELLAL